MERSWRLGSLTVLSLLGAWGQGRAQEAPTPRPRRWALTGSLGRGWGHGQNQIEEAMIAAGLDATQSFCLTTCTRTRHPISARGGETELLALSYMVDSVFQLRLQGNSTDLGDSNGYAAGSDSLIGGGYLTLFRAVKSVALLVGVNASGLLWVSAGPALEFPAVSTELPPRSHGARLGAVLRAALTVPAHRRVFLEAAWQFEYVPPVSTGPYVVRDPIADSTVATFPRTRVPLSHNLWAVGLGVRF